MDNHLSILYNPRKCALPNAWKLIRIGDCAKLIAGGTPSTYIYEYWTEGDIPWMRSGDVHKKRIYSIDGKITKQGLNNSNATLLPINSILVALAGQGKTRGTVAINKIELCTNQSVAAIIPNREIDYEFLYYNLDARYEIFRRLSTGEGGRGGLNLQIIKNIWCSLPPLPEQRKIAEILSTWDEAIEKTERLIAALQTRKKGLMHYLLTGERQFIDFKESTPKKDWKFFGSLPSNWQLVRLGDYAYVKARIGWRGLSSDEYTESGPYLIAAKHIKGNKILWENCDHISRYRYEESHEIILSEHDVIISKDGTLGRVGFVENMPGPATINSTMMLIRPKEEFDSKFIYYYLQGDYFQGLIKRRVSGSTIPHLFQRDIIKLIVPLPPKCEQMKIGEILTYIDEEIDLENQKLNTIKQQKKGLMQRLLTGQVRVKLNEEE